MGNKQKKEKVAKKLDHKSAKAEQVKKAKAWDRAILKAQKPKDQKRPKRVKVEEVEEPKAKKKKR